MTCSSLFIVVVFVMAFTPCALSFSQSEHETFQLLMKLLEMPQKPERHVSQADLKHPQPNIPKVTKFNWNSCGPATDPVSASVSILPDPLVIPGNITVSANSTIKVDLVSPLKLTLTIKKKVVLVWITIPCVDNVGSCTYDDACEMLDETFPPSDPCPEPFFSNNLPCHCPFKAGDYSLPPSVIEVTDIPIPSWLTSGDYEIKIVAQDSTGSELACFSSDLTLN